MTVRPNYSAEPCSHGGVKAGSNKAVDGAETQPEPQVTWKDLFTSLKMNHKVIRKLQCLSFMHDAGAKWDDGLSPQGGSLGLPSVIMLRVAGISDKPVATIS